MKTKLIAMFAVVLVVCSCSLFSDQHYLRVVNNTGAGLGCTVVAEGVGTAEVGGPGSAGGEGDILEAYINLPSGEPNIEVSVTLEGQFKLEEDYVYTAWRVISKEMEVEADAGDLSLMNHAFSNVAFMWALPADPLTYTSREQVIADALFVVEDIGEDDMGGATCVEGTYFVIIQTSETDYWYLSTGGCDVVVGEQSVIEAYPFVQHPVL